MTGQTSLGDFGAALERALQRLELAVISGGVGLGPMMRRGDLGIEAKIHVRVGASGRCGWFVRLCASGGEQEKKAGQGEGVRNFV
jgi:hypothetical protein